MTRFWRLAPFMALTAAVVLLAAAIAVGIYAERSYRAQKVQEATVQARILAGAVTAALAFGDVSAAEDYVEALAANPELRVAAVYDAGGNLFARYYLGEALPPPRAPTEVTEFEGNVVFVTAPVMESGVRLGTVYLSTRVRSIAQRLSQYAGIAFLGMMAMIVIAVLGISQSALNRANAELARHAAELEAANAELQVQMTERAKAEEALRQAQKMETIGHLTGGVAHDFNNLLAIILGNLERLQRRLADGSEMATLKRAVENAKAGAERAATLTRSLLAFSRRQPLKPQPVDVNKLVAGMSELLRRTLGEHIVIESVIAGGLWRTSVDPNQLESAILNLAVNARDAMPEGGRLTIETANAYLDESYSEQFEDVSPGQYVVLSITDTGAGMSKDVMEHAFEPFFTTKDVGHGTGLGLSQVYGVVKQSGGHIKLYSEPSQGTTVKIYLPRLMGADEAPAAPVQSPPEPARVAPGAAILVVEDDEGVREHSVAILRELGYRVFEAREGRAALRAIEERPEIVLLFTDVGLPGGMNGRQLADRAAAVRPGLKVLYTTGYARNAIVHDGRLDPGVHLVTKPFSYAEIAAAVRKVLAESRPAALVVEDEVLVRMNLVEMLGELGVAALEAGSAAEAESILRLRSAEVGAIVLDLGLPDAKGDAFPRKLRALWPHIPLIVASGSGEGAAALAGDPMVSFLPKPYGAAALEAALAAAGVATAPEDG